ncbi:conserved hypothetical protein [Sporisorium reilianum SRZ2]|uniref:DEK-C domain-containing protein n=1 Tax=Sporisorium reilianum (strain SRZ2) TaxID=999809 RepID=E6ZWS8_SPORE|nr:conserved hypothetical protein [Sporisorium reilianum SRZ2]
MSLPSDKQLVKQIRAILVEAYDNDTVAQHSKRKIREMLTEHFGVDLEDIKKKINHMTQEQNEQEQAARAQASTSRSASPVKADKAAKAKASPKGQPAKKETKKASGAASKRKQVTFQDDDVEEGEDGDEEDYTEARASASAAATSSTTVISDNSDSAPSDFSELEEDTSSRARTKKPTPTKKSSPSTRRKPSASTASGSEAEQRLARLKKLVAECGVRKQWKKLYEAASVSETDLRAQCGIVQGVLHDLGMTGKGSIEQARKIREEREFADELAGLQENTVLDAGTRTRRTRASGAKTDKPKKAIVLSDDEEDEDESDFEQVPAKRSRAKGSDSDEESQDDGPTRRKSFKSSLASFAADLNSDSD